MFLSRGHLQSLARSKIDDAQLLLSNNRCSNAYYLSGYALELGFKAAICRTFLHECLPDLDFVRNAYSHKLVDLNGLAGLKSVLREAMATDAQLASNWSIASQWSVSSRYEIVDEFRAVEMVQAVGDEQHGVLPWLKQHW